MGGFADRPYLRRRFLDLDGIGTYYERHSPFHYTLMSSAGDTCLEQRWIEWCGDPDGSGTCDGFKMWVLVHSFMVAPFTRDHHLCAKPDLSICYLSLPIFGHIKTCELVVWRCVGALVPRTKTLLLAAGAAKMRRDALQ